MEEEKTTQQWGYHPTRGVQMFTLKKGEKLPNGWSDKPHPGQHPHDAEQGREPAKEPAKS
jgi:hypothetical protein